MEESLKPKIDLTDQELKYIKSQISKNLKNCTASLFGSRVSGNSRKTSDLDICVRSSSGEPMPFIALGDLREVFQESSLPFFVDIVDYYAMLEEFRKVALKNEYPLSDSHAPVRASFAKKR